MDRAVKVEEEQEVLVDEIEDSNRDLSDVEIVKLFIKTEDDALKYLFQGHFFPSYHHEIKRIFSTRMKGIEEEEKIKFFFHTLRLGELYPSLIAKNYSSFKIAFLKFIPLLTAPNFDHLQCSFDEELAQILFNIRNINSSDIFKDISHRDLITLVQFYSKCNSYSDSENMLKKTKQFEKFSRNENLVNFLSNNIKSILKQEEFSHSSFLYGTLMIIVLSNEFFKNNTLFSIHKENLGVETTNFLKKYFYNYLSHNTYGQEHLNHLNSIYS